jgi:hypothetical protein
MLLEREKYLVVVVGCVRGVEKSVRYSFRIGYAIGGAVGFFWRSQMELPSGLNALECFFDF